MRRAALPASLAVAMTCLVTAQQPPVTTTTTGVIVDVAVIDAKGNPVIDLAPEDFELSEDGTRQRIVGITLVERGLVTPVTARAAAPDERPTSTVSPPAAMLRPSTITPSITAILFDRLSPESRGLARRAALAYVSTLTPPHDYAGVFLADLSLTTLQPFTNRRQALVGAIDVMLTVATANTALAAEPESKRVSGLDANLSPTAGAESAGGGFSSIAERQHRIKELTASDPSEMMMLQMELRMREGYQRFLAEFDGQASLAGLRSVVSSFASAAGRKSILYFTEKLPITERLKPRFDALIGEANRANITVYPVDAVGLRVHSTDQALSRNVAMAGARGIGDEPRDDKHAWTKDLESQSEMLASREGLVLGRLAKETGGFVIADTNDLGAGVARMQAERTVYYLLAYQPTNTKLDGTFRKVSVKVKRPKLTVRSRPGYLAPTEGQ